MSYPMYTNKQSGVTMLEVLVAILVLSFGLLGMLGMITNGLKMTSSSHYRTIAAQQLSSMADMINANPFSVDEYAPPTSSTTANCLTSSGCSSTKSLIPNLIANTDYALWQANIQSQLPNAGSIVCLDSSPADGNTANFQCSGSGRITVKVCWNESTRIAISGGGVSTADTSSDTCLSAQL